MHFSKKILSILLICLSITLAIGQNKSAGGYTLIVEGFDWGPAVNKVVLSMSETVSDVDADDFKVYATRTLEGVENPIQPASGERTVQSAYVSDGEGNRVSEGEYVTLNLVVGPTVRIASAFQYTRVAGRGGNYWVDYRLSVTNTATLNVWNVLQEKIVPIVDDFDLNGTFSNNGVTLTYASFKPEGSQDKYPLIIWLHGGGEGGTDASVPLLANRAANYASDEIQQYFGGAYVLSPQTPTRWMDSGNGSTSGQVDDIYFKALKALFDDFVQKNPNVDTDRIYVGGCSNGGYMSLKLILEYPDYFAAGYISALAFRSQYLTDDQVRSIRDVPMWFVHSKDDSTTVAANTVIPVYERLVEAKASDVHLSLYDHVVDITNAYGGENFYYPGHWSWIYSHANHSQTDYDGSPVMVNGVPVTIMQWMALQER